MHGPTGQETETRAYLGNYAVLSRRPNYTVAVEYLLRDRLGSVDAVGEANGNIAHARGYDAFGKPRAHDWADLTPPRQGSEARRVTQKGFTQHEHLDSVELTHMNGRAFDYNLGRFLSVDPFIQFPLNSQSLNPYSYILNNPMSGTDPTGYATCSVSDTGCKLDDGMNTLVMEDGSEHGVYIGSTGEQVEFRFSTGGTTTGTVGDNGGDIGSRRVNGAFSTASETYSASDTGASASRAPQRLGYSDNERGRLLTSQPQLRVGFRDAAEVTYLSAGEFFFGGDTNAPGDDSLQQVWTMPGPLAKTAAAGGALLAFTRRADDGLRAMTRENFRENLSRLTGGIPEGMHSHHVFPQKFAREFSRIGINVHDPRFGAWWEAAAHVGFSAEYNRAWQRFFAQGGSSEQALDFARKLASDYGYRLNF